MATFKDIVNYYKPYHAIAIFSITAASIFEVVDLLVPYAIGQILNVLSRQSLDKPVENAIAVLSQLTQLPQNQLLSIGFLLGIIFFFSFTSIFRVFGIIFSNSSSYDSELF